jgi:hypothetical protein
MHYFFICNTNVSLGGPSSLYTSVSKSVIPAGIHVRLSCLPDTLRVNANLFQTDLCRNQGYMDVFELAIHGTGYPLPGGYDDTRAFVYNDEEPVLSDTASSGLPCLSPVKATFFFDGSNYSAS